MNNDLLESKKMADKNYDFFTDNFDTLYQQYKEKYIVIKDCAVIGSYSSFNDAYTKTIKTEELGTFLIQHCTKEETTIGYFHFNNVAFVRG